MAGVSPDKDFKVEVSVAEQKESSAFQGPEPQQWMLNEHPEDKLRAGMKKDTDLVRDFGVADGVPSSSMTDDALQEAPGTEWVNT